MLFVHGPGGVGKSWLLAEIGRLASDRGLRVAEIDGRVVPASRSAVAEALGNIGATPDGDRSATAAPEVVLVDAFERLAALEEWVRADLLPELPASTVTVIAGRLPPSPEWRADSAWRDLLRVVSLRNLAPDESRAYLGAVGLDEALIDQVIRATHGHPFALALLSDILMRGAPAALDPLPPDLVRALFDRFLEAVPTDAHRRVLAGCAIARVTTEAMLRDIVSTDALGAPGDVAALFSWLRDLSFVEADQEGLHPNDLAREVLDAELRWRDPEGYRAAVRAAWRHVRGKLAGGGAREEQRRAIHDLKFLFRNLGGVRSPVDWGSWAAVPPEPESALPRDHAAVVALVRDAEGSESAAIAAHWLSRQAGGFQVVRRTDGSVRGVVALLDLSSATREDVSADPGALAAWRSAAAQRPLRPGETVSLLRFLVDADAYQDPSPTLTAAPVLQMQHLLQTPRVAWGFLAMFDPDRWNDYFAVADLHRVADADFLVGGRVYGLFAHDFRAVPVNDWIDLVLERGLSGEAEPAATDSAGGLLVLSQVEFEQAARQALRDLTHPRALAHNPLVRTRLVHDLARGTRDEGEVLHEIIEDAVRSLGVDARDDSLLRAVHRTYVRPAATQEAAASMLGVPFSSYRRHLNRGVARIVEWLWDRELHGGAEDHEPHGGPGEQG